MATFIVDGMMGLAEAARHRAAGFQIHSPFWARCRRISSCRNWSLTRLQYGVQCLENVFTREDQASQETKCVAEKSRKTRDQRSYRGILLQQRSYEIHVDTALAPYSDPDRSDCDVSTFKEGVPPWTFINELPPGFRALDDPESIWWANCWLMKLEFCGAIRVDVSSYNDAASYAIYAQN